MNLIIDQGNTRTKLALFKDGERISSTVLWEASDAEVMAWCAGYSIERGLLSSVVGDDLYESLRQKVDFPIYNLSHEMPLPFNMAYETPETLGLDRIALAAAAVSRFPNKNCLVIDAGTCITYDFISRAGEYMGGAIAPGLQMRFKAMHHFTARLPLINRYEEVALIGRSTRASMISGVINGLKHEVAGTIQEYEGRFPEMITVITGGDATVFGDLLKNSIFAAPDFLLLGLNNILDYHAEML